MLRLTAAALIFASIAVPAFACPWMDKSASDAQPSTLAAQPPASPGPATPQPSSTPADQNIPS